MAGARTPTAPPDVGSASDDVLLTVRAAVQAHLSALSPGRPTDRVTVTVTGLI
ncbi:hypothetical protein [Streptomyces sp. NPDC004014]